MNLLRNYPKKLQQLAKTTIKVRSFCSSDNIKSNDSDITGLNASHWTTEITFKSFAKLLIPSPIVQERALSTTATIVQVTWGYSLGLAFFWGACYKRERRQLVCRKYAQEWAQPIHGGGRTRCPGRKRRWLRGYRLLTTTNWPWNWPGNWSLFRASPLDKFGIGD